MPITMRCPRCQSLLSGPRRKEGQQIDCPSCSSAVVLSPTTASPRAPMAVFSSDVPAMEAESRPSMPWRGLTMTLWVILLILAGLAGVYAAHLLLQETTPSEVQTGATELPPSVPLERTELKKTDSPKLDPPPRVDPPAVKPSEEKKETPRAPSPAVEEKREAPRDPPAPPVAERQKRAEVSTTPDPKPKQLVVKRRKDTTEEELRKQLLDVPELLLDPAWIPGTDRSSILATLPTTNNLYLVSVEKDLVGHLPGFRWEAEGQLGPEPAKELEATSRRLRAALQASVPANSADKRIDADVLRSIILRDRTQDWRKPEAIPALQQLLMAESKPLRLLLVELLGKIDGKEASVALAQRALFDLAPQVREAAIKALQTRPAESYRQTLIDGFRYPWPPVADHAAEALIAIEDRAALTALVDLLKEGDPRLVAPGPTMRNKPGFLDGKLRVVEVVKVNHLANCMLCHKTSDSEQHPVRGSVPVPGQPLETKNGMFSPYEGKTGSTSIRADITRLKQDMSILQPVANPGQWPPHQRFDYLLRVRPVRPDERPGLTKTKPGADGKPEPVHLQRESVLFALRELTGKDVGTGHGQWVGLVKKEE